MMKNMDLYYRTSLLKEMLEVAERINRKRISDEQNKEKIRSLIKTLNQSSILHFYDRGLINRLLTSWQKVAEQRVQPDCENVAIVFKSIEIPADIVKPIFKVTVLVILHSD